MFYLPLCVQRVYIAFLLLVGSSTLSIAQLPKPLPLRPPNLKEPDSTHRAAMAAHDSLQLAEAYYLYGKRYASAGQHLMAKRWYIRSLRIQEKRGNSFEHGRLYMRLADLEADQWHQVAALRHNWHALAIFRRVPDYRGIAIVSFRLAHLHLGDYPVGDRTDNVIINTDSVRYYLSQAKRWSPDPNDPLQLADQNELEGKLLLRTHRPEAIGYLQQAALLHQKHSSLHVQIRSKANLASAHLKLGQTELARRVLNQMNQLYDRLPYQEYDVRIRVETISLAFCEATGDWKKAYIHQANLRSLEKSGLITDRDGAITRLGIEFETAKKDAQIRANNRELALQKTSLRNEQRFTRAMVVLLCLAVVGIMIFFRLYQQKNRLSHRNAQLVKEQNHRVKNNLQVVSSLLNLYAHRLADPISRMAVEESKLRVEAMALLQRQLYDRDYLTTVDLAAFIPELVERVLQTYGYNTLQPDYELNECEVSVDQALPIGLIINELTTNACKYAFVGNESPVVAIILLRNGNKIELTFADNGPGLPVQLLAADGRVTGLSDSFGLQLIQMQVDQLNGQYQWTSGNGTQFTMTFNSHT